MEKININGNRYYEKDGKRYPSVTSILKYYPKGPGFYTWLSSVTKEEAERIRDTAGEQGNNVHNAIEAYLRNEEIDYDKLTSKESELIVVFLDWYKELLDNHKVEIIALELPVLNIFNGYAGTVDMVLKIDDVYWIVDIKTSNYVQASHKLQLSAYKHSNWFGDKTVYGSPIPKMGIIHLKSKKFIEVEDCFDVFLAVFKIFKFETKNLNI